MKEAAIIRNPDSFDKGQNAPNCSGGRYGPQTEEKQTGHLAIFRAFTELLKEEGYSKITVQQIIDLADVGRTTFYMHFETKDALLESFCTEIFEHVFSEQLDKEKTHDFSGEHDTKARVTHILYHLQEHIEYLPGILSGDSDAVFIGYFKERLSELFEKSVQESEQVPHDYMLNHMVCDFAETIRWWAKHSQYSPEEISAFFFETTPGIS